MGYFDFLTSSYFKTGQDGRKQFFPGRVFWAMGTPSPRNRITCRLQQQIKIYMIVSLVLVIGAASLKGDLVGLLIATLLIGVHSVSATDFCCIDCSGRVNDYPCERVRLPARARLAL